MPRMPTAPRALFAGLVDDAALFPPGSLPMAEALAAHTGHRQAGYADLVGPFLCPASRVEELRAALPDDAPGLELSLVVHAPGEVAHRALRAVAADPRVTLAMVEAPHALLGADAAAVGANLARLPQVRSFLEAPWESVETTLDAVGVGGWYGVKARTGPAPSGAAAPTDERLAAFLHAGTTRSLPFKLTGGLHSAVRHTDTASGAEQHGFLNVLLAVRTALDGAGPEELAGVLAVRDPEALATDAARLTEAEARDVRRLFCSFGCCGVTDPVRDLVALGLVEGATP